VLENKMNYGGQAVIEGIMMRSKHHMSVAVRLENGKIKVKKQKIKQNALSRIFFIRGIYNLIEQLILGYKTLNWSAEQQMDEEEVKSSGWITAGATILGIVLAIALFKLFPLGMAKLANPNSLFVFNLIDGVIKLLIFLGYLWFIGRFKDVKRIFRYHGAEHKAIGCVEAGKKLTVENCVKYAKEHKRCGTNFLFIVIIVSILVYLIIPLNMSFWTKFGLRLLFLPIIAGIGYELIKLNKKDNWISNILNSPGILIQKLTTAEPDKKMLEVSIVALKEVMHAENKD